MHILVSSLYFIKIISMLYRLWNHCLVTAVLAGLSGASEQYFTDFSQTSGPVFALPFPASHIIVRYNRNVMICFASNRGLA